MTPLLRFAVLTAEKRLLDVEQVAWVQARLVDGSIGIYPGHAPLLGETAAGIVRYSAQSKEDTIALEPGLLWVEENVVTIFCPGATETTRSRPEHEQIHFERLVSKVAAAAQHDQSDGE